MGSLAAMRTVLRVSREDQPTAVAACGGATCGRV
jgi:hypothetical protein